jgi:ADP-dependent NAD(P)H-hydrate dehydratase / NAD(P)H-hydrate epimerase
MTSLRSRIPDALYRADQARELDRIAIQDLGIPGATLMERAGTAAFAALRARWPGRGRIAVVCGTGNNAGDGLVLARLARQAGLCVEAYQVGDGKRLTGDAQAAAGAWAASGGAVRVFAEDCLGQAQVAVDALFGTGLDREVEGPWRLAVEEINRSGLPVLALDIPSGLHADTGRVMGAAVRASVTVTFIALKQGLLTGQGLDRCGAVLFDDLGVPAEIYARVSPASRRLDWETVRTWLPERARSAHKGAFGHVLVVGGERGMSGAVRLAGEGAARVGAGLVSIATRAVHAPYLNLARPELMCHGIEQPEEIEPLLQGCNVVVIGPGLGRSPWGRALLDKALASDRPLVVDADGLNLLAQVPGRRGNWILTPHPGEAARLLGCATADVERDRFQAVRALQERYSGVCILKGAGTLIGSDGAEVLLCVGGNPGMASGGMGDVLSGVSGGLIAQGFALKQAAGLAVCAHARAGDCAAAGGERGMLASDLMPHLRALVNPR